MWELQANLIPKFGYCSWKFDDIARGKSLVQGQLAINYVSSGYLILALMGNQVTSTGFASPSSTPSSAAQQQMQQLLNYQTMLQDPIKSQALSPAELQAANEPGDD